MVINIKVRIALSLLFVAVVGFLAPLHAQETIATARPTLSIGPWVLPENSFQWEQGAQYSDAAGEAWAYDALIRASISKSAEVRIIVPSLAHRYASLELKWMMIQPNGAKPGVAFSINMGTNSNQEKSGDNFNILGYRVAISKSLSDKLLGFVNAGYTSDGYFGDLTLAYSISNKLTVSAEYWHHEDWKQAHTTMSYLINNETQIDINGGLLFDTSSDYTMGIGISRRFNYKDS